MDERDVAQAQHPPVNREIDVGDILFRAEGAGNTHGDRLVPSLDNAGGPYDVLRLQRGNQSATIDAEAGELLHRELDEDLLVLSSENFNLGDVGNAEELRTDILNIVSKLARREAIGGKAVNDAKRVAELIDRKSVV